MTELTDQQHLERIGIALYGPSWKGLMSKKLGVSPRTITYWVDGATIPPSTWGKLYDLCKDHVAELHNELAFLAIKRP